MVDPHGSDGVPQGRKPLADLVLGDFGKALSAVVDAGTLGAVKYSDSGWKVIENPQAQCANARMRHYLKRKAGEEMDQESGLPHLVHECWNALAELELYLKAKEHEETDTDLPCTCDPMHTCGACVQYWKRRHSSTDAEVHRDTGSD